MIARIRDFCFAKYRAFAPISCFESPHADVLRGFRRWRWLVKQRETGRLIDPSLRIRCGADNIEECVKLAVNVHIDRGVNIWIGNEDRQSGTIAISEMVYIGPNSFLGSCHLISIGRDSMIGANCYLTTVNHVTDRIDIPYAKQGFYGGNVTLGVNVWLGSNVVVLPGITIGDHAIIGAGAVVTKNVPSGETWGGVPAKNIEK